jgi:hypothetical protein
LLTSELDLSLEARSFSIVRLECSTQTVVGRGIEISSALFGAVNRVSKRLRRFVRELSRAECFEPRFAVVECILRRFAGAVELLFQSVE